MTMKLDAERFPPHLLEHIGFEKVVALDAADGVARVAYVARSDFTHSNGRFVQGGLVTAWLDNAMAFAVFAVDPALRAATLELKVSFLEAATPGRQLVEARLLKRGSTIAFLEADLFSGNAVLARATSTVRRF